MCVYVRVCICAWVCSLLNIYVLCIYIVIQYWLFCTPLVYSEYSLVIYYMNVLSYIITDLVCGHGPKECGSNCCVGQKLRVGDVCGSEVESGDVCGSEVESGGCVWVRG